MVELHQQPRLPHEALGLDRVGGELGLEHLQRHRRAVGAIRRGEHPPDAALPDQLAQLIAREARPGPALGRQPLLPLRRAADARLDQETSGFTGRNRFLRKRRRHDPTVHEQGQQLRRRDHVRCRGNRLRYLGRSIRSASSLLRAGPDHLGVE